MNIQDLNNAEELFFIDIETVNAIGICQIGITKWSKAEQRLCVVFNEIINPDVPAESINIHATSSHWVSEYAWSKAKPYNFFHPQIKKLLDGKIVLQWGGADIAIIKKNILDYNLEDLNVTALNTWNYQFKGVKLTTAAETLGVSYKGLHNASYDAFLTALLFVSEMFGYKITNIDMKIIDSFNSRASQWLEPFKIGDIKTNGSGAGVCLTGFSEAEKKKFGELLAGKGFRIRSSVTADLKFLVTPSGGYKRSPGKEADAAKVGAKILDLNSFLSLV